MKVNDGLHSLRLITLVLLQCLLLTTACEKQHGLAHFVDVDGAYIITGTDGRKLRVKSYGEQIIRLQVAELDESFLPDDFYEMVQTHDWRNVLSVTETDEAVLFSTKQIRLVINRQTLAAQFYHPDQASPLLSETRSPFNEGTQTKVTFAFDSSEHFTALGHGYCACANSVDLRGQKISRVYGSKPIEQAPLIVPFYMSSKGYGVFLNSLFENTFSFGSDNEYSIAIDDRGQNGQMDYYFIAGPELKQVLNGYTALTGRPRLPQKSLFGLQLSDKAHDHNSPTPSDEIWWKEKIESHRAAGYPLDHVVNDNRWRAAGGKRCESKLEWDPTRYPKPAAYQQWLASNGLTITLDFNRCIGQYSDGWQPSFNLPETGEIEFPESAPDLTNEAFQQWFWQVFYDKALRPDDHYPGDALWIDEFDEQGHAPKDMILSNGRSSGEMRNYWFYLIAKSLVADGWDKSGMDKRPFVWVRGMTAGAQRFATLWSGDIYPNYQDMESQIRGMQLAGLSGFPFWGHDAGGFYDWTNAVGPDENLYQRWAMAFGSFAPIWKPHGMGQSRWPLDRSEDSQATALIYSTLRYRLMPYIYSAAHQASITGLPMARAMLLEYQDQPEAWQYDLQYMWGPSLLVAPATADTQTKDIWLPDGLWYDYFTNVRLPGGRVIHRQPAIDNLPLFVKAGAIIPSRDYELSTRFIDKSRLTLQVYAGADGRYELIEDDDVTEQYQQNARAITEMTYHHKARRFTINPTEGAYDDMPQSRDITIRLIGAEDFKRIEINDNSVPWEVEGDDIVIRVKQDSLREPIVLNVL